MVTWGEILRDYIAQQIASNKGVYSGVHVTALQDGSMLFISIKDEDNIEPDLAYELNEAECEQIFKNFYYTGKYVEGVLSFIAADY